MKMKKAAALSLETVAVAAIVLIVLIIVVATFKGGIGKIIPTVGKLNECIEGKGGYCFEPDKDKDKNCDSGTKIWGMGCEARKDGSVYCCIPLSK
jgi:hypothetical protein